MRSSLMPCLGLDRSLALPLVSNVCHFREAIVDTFEKMIKKYDLKDSDDPIAKKVDVQQQQEHAEGAKQPRGVSGVGV